MKLVLKKECPSVIFGTERERVFPLCFRRQESVHHRRRRHPRSFEPSARRRVRRHGLGHSQEGQARAPEESHARRRHQAEEDLQEEGRLIPLFRGQRGSYSE